MNLQKLKNNFWKKIGRKAKQTKMLSCYTRKFQISWRFDKINKKKKTKVKKNQSYRTKELGWENSKK